MAGNALNFFPKYNDSNVCSVKNSSPGNLPSSCLLSALTFPASFCVLGLCVKINPQRKDLSSVQSKARCVRPNPPVQCKELGAVSLPPQVAVPPAVGTSVHSDAVALATFQVSLGVWPPSCTPCPGSGHSPDFPKCLSAEVSSEEHCCLSQNSSSRGRQSHACIWAGSACVLSQQPQRKSPHAHLSHLRCFSRCLWLGRSQSLHYSLHVLVLRLPSRLYPVHWESFAAHLLLAH